MFCVSGWFGFVDCPFECCLLFGLLRCRRLLFAYLLVLVFVVELFEWLLELWYLCCFGFVSPVLFAVC